MSREYLIKMADDFITWQEKWQKKYQKVAYKIVKKVASTQVWL